MVNAREGHEIPEDKPEANEGAERPDGFAAYEQAGGTLSATEFQKVLGTTSSVRHRHLAEEAGISDQFKQIWATSIIGAFGRDDTRVKSTKWLRDEADAFYAMQNAGRGAAAVVVIQNVDEVAAGAHGKVDKVTEQGGFSEYKAHSGSLDEATYDQVMNARYANDVYGAAMKQIIGFGMGLPDHSMVEMCAKLKTVLGDDARLKNEMWLMPELYILLKRY